MPDRDNWTAAMVLKWVLTRDLPTVLIMAEIYGADIVSEDGIARPAVPEDLGAVVRAYCIDPTVPPGRQKVREAVLHSQTAIRAKAEIYRALQRGELEARARRNGSGDVETIPPNQWLALRFQSWKGHDLAVPIDIDQDVLDLPRPVRDYLRGRVPADVRPAVWPDPLFRADQVTTRWLVGKQKIAPGGGEPSRSQDRPYDAPIQAPEPVTTASRPSSGELRDDGVPGEPTVLSRPDGISDRAWATYQRAGELREKHKGNISAIARAIAKEERGSFGAVRRDIHRVKAALSKKS